MTDFHGQHASKSLPRQSVLTSRAILHLPRINSEFAGPGAYFWSFTPFGKLFDSFRPWNLLSLLRGLYPIYPGSTVRCYLSAQDSWNRHNLFLWARTCCSRLVCSWISNRQFLHNGWFIVLRDKTCRDFPVSPKLSLLPLGNLWKWYTASLYTKFPFLIIYISLCKIYARLPSFTYIHWEE